MKSEMHGSGDSSVVPAFLSKLWTLVEDESTNDLIFWDASGKSFHVLDQARFSKEILPLYFKHNNIASFIRQLNMYGFRKVMNVENGGLKIEKDDLEFQHPFFIQDCAFLLENIKRKVSNVKNDEVKLRHDSYNRVLTDVHSLRGKQANMDSKLDNLKRENEALWREVANMRQKHMKQQQIVNKLIQFIVTLVGSNKRGIPTGMKRHFPLMINDASQLSSPPKRAKIQHKDDLQQGVLIHDITDQLQVADADHSIVTPLIEMANELSPQAIVTELPSPPTGTSMHTVQSPAPSATVTPNQQTSPANLEDVRKLLESPPTTTTTLNLTDTSLPASLFSNSPVAKAMPPSTITTETTAVPSTSNAVALNPKKSVTEANNGDHPGFREANNGDHPGFREANNGDHPGFREANNGDHPGFREANNGDHPGFREANNGDHPGFRGDMTDHVDKMQSDLDTLKELLATSAYSLDNSTLLSLFNPEGPIPATPENLFSDFTDAPFLDLEQQPGTSAGNELMTYQPTDLGDLGQLFDLPDLSASSEPDLATGELTTPILSPSDSNQVTTEEVD